MTEPTDIAIAAARSGRERGPARIAVALPVAGTPGTGALVTGARARVRHAGQAGTIRLLPLRPGQAWPRRMAA
jgi:hypothetical protein